MKCNVVEQFSYQTFVKMEAKDSQISLNQEEHSELRKIRLASSNAIAANGRDHASLLELGNTSRRRIRLMLV